MNYENEGKSEPNALASSLRHRRVFLRSVLFSRTLFRLLLDIKGVLRFSRGFVRGLLFRRLGISTLATFEHPIVVKDPFRNFFRHALILGGALFVVTSVTPQNVSEIGYTVDYVEIADALDQIEEQAAPSFLINDEGFVLKPSSATEEVSRIGFTDSVKHTVVSGDTLSGIATLYGIRLSTLLWENNISEEAPLKIGATLVIPPLDGVAHIVASNNETVASIAKSYGADAKIIREHNDLSFDKLTKGQRIFIPGGKKKETDTFIARGATRSSGRNFVASNIIPKRVMSSTATPVPGKRLIFPTSGNVTQGFTSKHYGLDIGNRGKPDVWASAAGVVKSIQGGCPEKAEHLDRGCGGGYGNVVVIDHGNGLETRYAHLDSVYVTAGQKVERGQAIGKMGSSGRVYGVTGIHLHFEVIDKGAKQSPFSYM